MTKTEVRTQSFVRGMPIFFGYESGPYGEVIVDHHVVEVGFFVEVSDNYLTVADRKLLLPGEETPQFRTVRRVKLDKIIDLRPAFDEERAYA